MQFGEVIKEAVAMETQGTLFGIVQTFTPCSKYARAHDS